MEIVQSMLDQQLVKIHTLWCFFSHNIWRDSVGHVVFIAEDQFFCRCRLLLVDDITGLCYPEILAYIVVLEVFSSWFNVEIIVHWGRRQRQSSVGKQSAAQP